LTIIGAFYGDLDITDKVRVQYDGGRRDFLAADSEWTDPWPGMYKTLVIVYREGQNHYVLQVIEQNQHITVPAPSCPTGSC